MHPGLVALDERDEWLQAEATRMAAERRSMLDIRWALIEASRRFTRPRVSRHHVRARLEQFARAAVTHSEPGWFTALHDAGLVGKLMRDDEGVAMLQSHHNRNQRSRHHGKVLI
ncbi:MAG: hypothetical protein ACREA0_06230 [bacterium]